MVLGFISYELSIFLAQQPTSFLGGTAAAILASVSLGQSADVAIMMKFAGGIITIIGLIVAINGVASTQRIDVRSFKGLQATVQELESSVRTLRSPTSSQPSLKQQSPCKFCGVSIDLGESFCPACGKAQG